MIGKLIIIMLCMFFLGIGLKYFIQWFKIKKDRDGRRGYKWHLVVSIICLVFGLSFIIGNVWHNLCGELGRIIGG